jgi:hypothetical protein
MLDVLACILASTIPTNASLPRACVATSATTAVWASVDPVVRPPPLARTLLKLDLGSICVVSVIGFLHRLRIEI